MPSVNFILGKWKNEAFSSNSIRAMRKRIRSNSASFEPIKTYYSNAQIFSDCTDVDDEIIDAGKLYKGVVDDC